MRWQPAAVSVVIITPPVVIPIVAAVVSIVVVVPAVPIAIVAALIVKVRFNGGRMRGCGIPHRQGSHGESRGVRRTEQGEPDEDSRQRQRSHGASPFAAEDPAESV